MELLDNVGDISKIGYGFMASKALFTALDLDLFSRLERARASVEELAAEAEITPHRLQLLLTVLRALGLIGLDQEGKHYNSPAASSYLASTSPAYFGDYFRLQIDRQFYPILTKLAPAIRGAESTHFYSEHANPEEAKNFSKAQHVGSLGAAHLLARRLGTVPWRSLLDVAGGTGAFSIMLCKRNPLLSAPFLTFRTCARFRWSTSRLPALQIGLAWFRGTHAQPTGLSCRMQSSCHTCLAPFLNSTFNH
ncbi:MAG: methyltransferase dimerization domain-containing protein [Lysobacterales bacterium]